MLAALLSAAAAHEDGAPESALMAAALAAVVGSARRDARRALDALVQEYYLAPGANSGTWRFTPPLLRRWWRRYRSPS